MTAIASPEGTTTVRPPEGSVPLPSRPKTLSLMGDMARERLAEIEVELNKAETRIRALLVEQATLQSGMRVLGG